MAVRVSGVPTVWAPTMPKLMVWGVALTVSDIVVLADSAPLVPLTVSKYDPGATDAPTLIVTIEDVVTGFVPNVPVIPAGQPAIASVTPELKPLVGVTITVDAALAPATVDAAPALKPKLGAALTVNEMVVLADNAPLVPLTVST